MICKSPEELARERVERVIKVLDLKEPDRVPLFDVGGHIVPAYGGITFYEYCYEYDKARNAIIKYLRDFQYDSSFASITGLEGFIFSVAFADYPSIAPAVRFIVGPFHDVLGDKFTRFPGRELPEDAFAQFLGGKFMEPDEYANLADDPVKFIAETILPRACTNLEKPGSAKSLAALTMLGLEINKYNTFMQTLGLDLAKLGYPSLMMTFAYTPLDFIGDFLRYPTGVLLDVRRHPDDVKRACEALIEPIVKVALALKPFGANLAFIPLHLNEYLSPRLYVEFYWNYLKKIIIELFNQGIKSFVFFEGHHDAHLETILDLPKGWGIAYFEKTDVRKAKSILKGHTCVMGGIPVSLLIGGTPEKIDEYIRELLREVMPEGGFILAPGTAMGLARETPIENIKALICAVEKYGKY